MELTVSTLIWNPILHQDVFELPPRPSPDNQKAGYQAFQDEFTYRCVDTTTSELLWTRKQPMSEARPGWGPTPEEGSPVEVRVSDKDSTIIYSGHDELFVISPTGRDVCHSFRLTKDGQSVPFVPEPSDRKRHEYASEIKVGMSAKEILKLIGAPNFVSYDTWSYDMDAQIPFSLTLKLDAKKATRIKREDPLWKYGLLRDEALVY